MDLKIEVAKGTDNYRGVEEAIGKKTLQKILRKGAQIIAKDIKARAPVDKGWIKKSVRVAQMNTKGVDQHLNYKIYLAKVYPYKRKWQSLFRSGITTGITNPFYAWFVHNGTVTSQGVRKHRAGASVGRERIKANPFIADAWEAKADEAADYVTEEINNEIFNHIEW